MAELPILSNRPPTRNGVLHGADAACSKVYTTDAPSPAHVGDGSLKPPLQSNSAKVLGVRR